jgi:hypothetical protein
MSLGEAGNWILAFSTHQARQTFQSDARARWVFGAKLASRLRSCSNRPGWSFQIVAANGIGWLVVTLEFAFSGVLMA